MDSLIKDFRVAYTSMKGDQIAETINPSILLHKTRLQDVWGRGNLRDAQADLDFLFRQDKSRPRMSKEEANGWYEIFLSYWKAVGELLAAEGLRDNTKSSWTTVYEKWKDFTLLVVRGYTHHEFENWTIPCLYVAGRYLRLYAIRADDERRRSGDDAEISFTDDIEPESENNRYLVECSRHLNRIFQICLSDRAPIEESRKWGIYYAINLLFKTFFKLNNASLCKGVLKALSATSKDMPSIDKFPKSQQVTFKYYEGVLAFLEEDYVKAEQHLTQAWHLCHKDATSNLELILSYLVPCHLLTTHTLPSAQLLAPYPKLQKLFLPLAESIKKADLHAFDVALQESEDEFIRRRIYLTLERGRDIALRNLLRKVFLAGGFENAAGSSAPVRRTRIPVSEFTAAINLSSQQKTDPEEVECLLANMIYKNLMKGYIAHERGIVVLSKNGAFPGTGV